MNFIKEARKDKVIKYTKKIIINNDYNLIGLNNNYSLLVNVNLGIVFYQ